MILNLYSIPFVISFLINLVIGFLVISQNHRHRTNVLFSCLALVFVIWNFSYIMLFNAPSSAFSLFWAKCVWTSASFLGAIYIHLALAFPRPRKLLSNPLLYVALYVPALAFAGITWLTPLMVSGPASSVFTRYFYAHGSGIVPYTVYLEVMFLIGIVLFASIWRRSSRKREKMQSQWMLFATLIPIIGGSVSNLFLPLMGYAVYPVAPVLTAVMTTLIAYAILKYRIISVTPASAAEIIISMLPGIFILLDTEQKILHTNKRLLEILEYGKGELTGRPINTILAREEQTQGLPWKRWEEKNYYQNFNINFATKSGKNVLISFSGTILEDEHSDIAGLVGIGFPVNG